MHRARGRLGWRSALLFGGPLLAVLLGTRLVSLVGGLILSFQRTIAFGPGPFVGLANYARLLNDEAIRAAVVNNLIILVALEVAVIGEFFLAAMIADRAPGSRGFRVILLIPVVIPPIAAGVFWRFFLTATGPFNALLNAIGLNTAQHPWLASPETALACVIFVVIWSNLGLGVLYFVAALSDVDQEMRDAAAIDGASWLQATRRIILPEMRSTIGFWGIVTVLTSFFGVFPIVFILTNGGPGRLSAVIELILYDVGTNSLQIGYASAIGLTSTAGVLVVILIGIRLLRTWET